MATTFSVLARYYHLLFPARAPQLEFLCQLAGPPPARVFDVASGTGEYTAALYARGYDCFGIDIDPAMHAAAKTRHPELMARERLLQGDMLELTDLVRGPARLAYCIGNSLPQLPADDALREALLQMWDLTQPGGAVALQVVNFDRVLGMGIDSFPLPELTLQTEDGAPLKLERHFTREAGDEHVVFHTRFTHPGGVEEHAHRMLALTRARLAAVLPTAARTQWFGSFSGEAWSAEAPATIAVLS